MTSYKLGLDIGANSVGWAALTCSAGDPCGILASGVRVFAAGMSGLESGKDESNAAQRRAARLSRRQTDRRRRRVAKVYNLLARGGLLPPAANVQCRNSLLSSLDRALASKLEADANLPYRLRATALDTRLELFELGRALFHLAQRRGFLSNRKSRRNPEEERSKVKEGISSLASAIDQANCRTLGEYFAKQDPSSDRIRGRYTSRSMYVHEFEAIWSAQERYHSELLTPTLKSSLFSAIFDQRPLRDQHDLIGECELENGRKRAPLWHPSVQRFRLLQELNNLRLIDSSGVQRPLDSAERDRVRDRLQAGDLPLKEFRKLLGLSRNVDVNLDRGGKQSLIGDRTEHSLQSVFGPRWSELTPGERFEAIEDLTLDHNEDWLSAKARERWRLDPAMAEVYSETVLEQNKYAAYSLEAIERLLPHLAAGVDLTAARKREYPETFRTDKLTSLPPVIEYLRDLRNPAVLRALTEVRKVVNALIRRFGKPIEVHVELARELKATRLERENRWRQMRQNERERAAAAKSLLTEVGLPNASRADVEKWLLAEECNWQCPYSGRSFSKQQLFHTGEIQVEHIIPFSRSLDDSFVNKTLAYVSANALKGNRAPQEAFGQSDDWEDLLSRVNIFKGPHRKAKLRRFKLTTGEVEEARNDFTTRQLNDTRYSSRLAARYLACLYGGLWDEGGQRIYVSPGQITAQLRRLWAIEGLLSNDGKKGRDDHRHHAVDAIVIASTSSKWINALCDSAERANQQHRGRFTSISAPWPGFAPDVKAAIGDIVISHRVDRRISGAMHDETLYGQIATRGGQTATVYRKPVFRLSATEIEQIVDDRVRQRVREQLDFVGGDPKKLETAPPTLPTRDGRSVIVKSVRIAIAEKPRQLAPGIRVRNVLGGDYHHFEILRRTDPRTRKNKWTIVPVTTQEAMDRVRARCPVVCRAHGLLGDFVCSIAKKETLEIIEGDATRLVTVEGLEATTNRVGFKSIFDARPYAHNTGNRERRSITLLMETLKARKVTVTPTGEVFRCND